MKSIHLQHTLPNVFTERTDIHSDIWLQDVTFEKDNFYLVEAASGTGKSSLCSFIYGYRKDYQGTITFDAENTRDYSISKWVDIRKHTLSILFQELRIRSEEHTSELQSPDHLVCRLLLEKKKNNPPTRNTPIHPATPAHTTRHTPAT